MTETRKVQKRGGSLLVAIPSQIAGAFKIENGSIVEYSIKDNAIIITLAKPGPEQPKPEP